MLAWNETTGVAGVSLERVGALDGGGRCGPNTGGSAGDEDVPVLRGSRHDKVGKC